mmetsp:Transcript_43972/g.106617  ORF Transcript_43972/g.106617 Transcript_43972/m.106617 type:complete len:221 (+) Transcript_43972:1104-1766(+)
MLSVSCGSAIDDESFLSSRGGAKATFRGDLGGVRINPCDDNEVSLSIIDFITGGGSGFPNCGFTPSATPSIVFNCFVSETVFVVKSCLRCFRECAPSPADPQEGSATGSVSMLVTDLKSPRSVLIYLTGIVAGRLDFCSSCRGSCATNATVSVIFASWWRIATVTGRVTRSLLAHAFELFPLSFCSPSGNRTLTGSRACSVVVSLAFEIPSPNNAFVFGE